ncbi:MAG: hypothetical protein AAF216_01300 [Pseudomonadota bacterium]
MAEFHDRRTEINAPVMTFPDQVRAHVERCYAKARIILEYGSGGSTVLAAGQPGKFIQSVESDFDWAMNMRSHLDEIGAASPVVIYPIDIGPVGMWGRPIDGSNWQKFQRYPNDIWDQPFFRHPDLVLIDGRFRPACFATVCIRITRPVRLLFDDYLDRPEYHGVETLAKPARMIGRMAEFQLEPRPYAAEEITLAQSFLSLVKYAPR